MSLWRATALSLSRMGLPTTRPLARVTRSSDRCVRLLSSMAYREPEESGGVESTPSSSVLSRVADESDSESARDLRPRADVEVVCLYPHPEAKYYAEALALREKVLWALESPKPSLADYSLADKRSNHFAAIDSRDGAVVGVASLDGTRMRQVAVDPDRKGLGIGAALVASIANKCRTKAGTDAVLLVNAWSSSAPFYRKCGFLNLGDEYESVGVMCQKMYMPLRQPITVAEDHVDDPEQPADVWDAALQARREHL